MLPQSTPPTRGRVLEEAFFYQADRELSEVLSKRVQREEKIRLFANATGIRDQKHLERLADSGFELSTLHFVWVPLILVAWADGNAEKLEKKAIADILASKGISHETISRVIAHDWFRKKPTEELWEIWAEFSAATDLPPLNGTASRERIWGWSKPREATNATRKEETRQAGPTDGLSPRFPGELREAFARESASPERALARNRVCGNPPSCRYRF